MDQPRPPVTPTAPFGVPAWVGKALLAIAALFLLQAAKPVLLPLTIAVLLTFLLFGPVRALTRIGLPPALGAAIVVVTLLAALGVAASALAGPAADWWDRAPQNLQQITEAIDKLRASIPGLEPPRRPARSVAPPADPVKERLASEGFTMTRAVLTHFWRFALFGGVTVILLYFLLASEYHLLSRTVQAIPRRRTRAVVLAGVRQAQREVGQYLATAGLINICLGLLTGVVLARLGLANPLLWGTMVAVLNFVPYIGPLLMVGMLGLAGILTYGVSWAMLAPAGAFLGLHAIESNVVTPLVVGRRLRLNPMAVFLSVMIWGWIWGIAGAFIAVPMLLAIRSACRRVRKWRLLYGYLNDTLTPPTSLRSLVQARIGRSRPPKHARR
ncbi:AI-2E family transporter [Ideonella sp. BN130291]|uniref:AI-2E family transporter n=1 Tax=Ideonella sp. BN130291 TaxID=3112940 RepID=UPI002E25EAFC|nr:AI-2E family transporter [Ideonella sp. BN130291]